MKRISFATMAAAAVSAIAAVLWLAVPAGASPSRAVSGTQHFQLITASATAATIPVIAWGRFTAGGVDHQGTNVDKLVFPGGTFKVRHTGGTTRQTMNRRTCLTTISGRGPVKIFGGTGRFAHISGAGRYRLSIILIAARSKGKCSMTKAPVAFQQIIKATARVKF